MKKELRLPALEVWQGEHTLCSFAVDGNPTRPLPQREDPP
jgi:hypothetical protein